MAQSSSHLVHRDFVLLCGAQQREAARDKAKGVEGQLGSALRSGG